MPNPANPSPIGRALRPAGAFVAAALLALSCGCATSQPVALHQPTVVEAACGECKFGMKGKDCDLAIRVHGRSYFVDGVKLDSLGDAHAPEGMCTTIRKARVTGEVRHGRFIASTFELLPQDTH